MNEHRTRGYDQQQKWNRAKNKSFELHGQPILSREGILNQDRK